MKTLLRNGLMALLGLGFLAGFVGASKPPSTSNGIMTVEDRAGVFTAEGIRKAESAFEDVTFKTKTHYTVVTLNTVPESKKKDFEETKKDKNRASGFFGQWAHEIADHKGESGILVLVFAESKSFFVKAITDKKDDVFRKFHDDEATNLEKKLIAAFKDAQSKSGDEAKTTRDAGLRDSAEYVISKLRNTTAPTGKINADTTDATPKKSWWSGIWGWVCLGACVLLGVWVVVALIRALTGGGGGGGYGGGGYGGYGGGGGGFMSSFIGGMFGAAAGMWMYNSFFGGHSQMDAGQSAMDNGYGGDNGAIDNGEGNFDNGAEGQGGGDWGNDGAGGVGDAGGGGDWGDSGGGDAGGGGGGGDWGGGGDAGGGGDFGGGGGGGDW